jgi:hypothetical protein
MALPRRKGSSRGQLRGLMGNVVWRPIGKLKEFPGNPRRHPESQIANLMKSIRRFWTNPILVDETGAILAGHGRWEAARRLGMSEVPTVTVSAFRPADRYRTASGATHAPCRTASRATCRSPRAA